MSEELVKEFIDHLEKELVDIETTPIGPKMGEFARKVIEELPEDSTLDSVSMPFLIEKYIIAIRSGELEFNVLDLPTLAMGFMRMHNASHDPMMQLLTMLAQQ